MEKYRPQLLTLCSLLLLSCASESEEENIRLELLSPDPDRQIQSFGDDTEWRVDVSINALAVQTFYFTGLEAEQSVSVTGVRLNEDNAISTTWFEVLNGYEVEISRQETSSFFADGNTTVSAEHTHTQFDYDSDGRSNFDERMQSTCVWSSDEVCREPGQTDIPTDNVLINGDFSNSLDTYWWASGSQHGVVNGEYCVTPADFGNSAVTILGFRNLLFLEADSRYTIEFSVRAQTNAEITVSMALPEFGFRQIYNNDIEVSTSSEKFVRSFDYRQNSQTGVRFTIASTGGLDNLFCFDDVKLIRESL